MQLEPWQYADHFLLVTVWLSGEKFYSFLSDHMTQAEVVQHSMTYYTSKPGAYNIVMLDEESYDLLEPIYRKQGKNSILED